jgi:hypothetical protein
MQVNEVFHHQLLEFVELQIELQCHLNHLSDFVLHELHQQSLEVDHGVGHVMDHDDDEMIVVMQIKRL